MQRSNINDVCDYIIQRVAAAEASLNVLKLQKLLYYSQAWCLAFYSNELFDGKFQAWVHGPVNRSIYDRFSETKSLYSDVTEDDVRGEFDAKVITPDARAHIDSTLEVYMKYTGTQLEEMTHREDPWVAARHGIRDSQRCEIEIDEKVMQSFYAARVA